MFASAEVAFGFLAIFMLLVLAAFVGTVILVIKGVYSVISGVVRQLMGLPSQPAGRYPTARSVPPYNPHAHRPDDRPGRRPEYGPEHDDADLGSRVYCTSARCGHENRPQARFCARCGHPIGPRA